MENKTFRQSVSAIVIVAMVASIFGVMTLMGTDGVFASEGTADAKVIKTNSVISPNYLTTPAIKADSKLNKHVFTKYIKTGKWNDIISEGHRYTDVFNKYKYYVESKGDHSQFVEGEEFFMPSTINVKGKRLNKTFGPYTITNNERLSYSGYGVRLYSSEADKFTITTEFRKCIVNMAYDSYYDEYYPTFNYVDSNVYTVKDTFFVQTKIKLSYNKKKGKLAKKKRTTYKNPTQKYGKLPKPKAKKGYKFVGWYTKKSGGKKVTKSTKVPSKNSLTLYARYKKK